MDKEHLLELYKILSDGLLSSVIRLEWENIIERIRYIYFIRVGLIWNYLKKWIFFN